MSENTYAITVDGTTIMVSEGTSLLEAVRRAGGISAPCGGKGTCGKCRVLVESEAEVSSLSPPDPQETAVLGERAIGEGTRLACRARVLGPVTLGVPGKNALAAIQTRIGRFLRNGRSFAEQTALRLPVPTVHDQRDDITRLLNGLSENNPPPFYDSRAFFQAARVLSSCLSGEEGDESIEKEKGVPLLAVLAGGRILQVRRQREAGGRLIGAAADIGTTTVVVYLLDLETGEVLDAASGLNAQKEYGGDVISRIEHAAGGGLEVLQKRITSQISELLSSLVKKHVPDQQDGLNPLLLTVCGNTVMTHLFLGLSPERIARAPFIPSSTAPVPLRGSDVGMKEFKDLAVYTLPAVASYVGSDISAGIMATGIDTSEEYILLIDIGTNGEIVLGKRDALHACSTAAGPAFEGAHISCGIGGVSGAVSEVWDEPGKGLQFATIGEKEPVGICGSGILDTLALLLSKGIVDETGRMLDNEDLEPVLDQTYLKRMGTLDAEPAFRVCDGRGAEPLWFTAKDVREVQLAKAAIAAGIATLADEAGIDYGEIKAVYLAGGFGSYLRPESAAALGLIPSVLLDRIIVPGNTAGQGAVMAACAAEVWERLALLPKKITYHELSVSPGFQNAYMEHMMFPVE